MEQVSRIEGNNTTEIKIIEKILNHQIKPKKMRKRDMITYKLKKRLELSKSEKRTWESKTSSHIWSQCPNLRECTNSHFWLTQKSQTCNKCEYKTTSCICTSKLKATRCQQCEKTSINCQCNLPKERNIQAELASAMASYGGPEKIRSISHLTALMAGGGTDVNHCV